MKILTRKALCLSCAFSLSTLLAACGPDDTDASNGDTYSLLDTMAPLDWPVGDMALGDEGYLYQNPAPIPASAPMMRYAREDSGYAPAYDYGSTPYYEEGYYGDEPYYDDEPYYGEDPYYDDEPYYDYSYGYDEPYYDYGYADSGFYDSTPSFDGLGLLALVAFLGGVLDDSQPDYYFDYGGARPWAWHTDRYVRYAEPIHSGYRYYYYEPGVARPFLVRDPSYSYGYRNDRLVVIYDRDGRALDNRRAWKQRKAAIRHFNRARHLRQAARNRPHHRVSISQWNERKTVIMRDQRRWRKEHENRAVWRKWTNNREKAIRARWPQKQTNRVAARQRSYMWRQAETPRFYKEARKAPRARKVAENRQRMFRKAAAYRRHEAQIERRRDRAKERVRNRRAFDRTVTTEQRRIARDRKQAVRQRANRNDRMTRRHAETQQIVRARRQAEARQKVRKQVEARRHQQARAEQRARTQRQVQQRAKAHRQEARAKRQTQQRQQARKQAEARRAEQRARTQRQAQQKAKARRQEARAQRQAQQRQQAQRQAEARRQQARAEQRARTQRQAQQQAKARRQEARAERQAQARRQEARRQTQARRQQVRAQRQERSQRNSNRQRAVRAAFHDRKGR